MEQIMGPGAWRMGAICRLFGGARYLLSLR